MLHQEWARYAVWAISLATVLAVVLRPRRLPEALWAVLGALALVVLGLVPPGEAVTAIARGGQVYAFLLGMLLLARLLENEGVFAWLAGYALRAAGNSRVKLFGLIFGVGIAVTIFLSNDATAVVLTPAVAEAVRRAGLRPYAYLYACAFVANAASFVLPISNPANLVVFGGHLPPLADWLAAFGIPSVISVGATFVTLRWLARRELRGGLTIAPGAPASLTRGGRLASACAARLDCRSASRRSVSPSPHSGS
jgi:arsenical pump membrane protein